jgi:hypothetical protein
MLMFVDAFNCYEKHFNEFEGNYLEIGVYQAELLCKLAKNYPDRQFYGIDPFIEDGFTEPHSKVQKGNPLITQKSAAYENLKKVPNTKLFEMTSKEFVEKHTDNISDLNISFVVIDGSHYYEDIIIDYNLAMNCIGEKKGIILWDDFQITYVQSAFDKFTKEYSNRIEKIETIAWNAKSTIILPL